MLSSAMAKKDTQGFFIRPERELVNRLERLSKEFKKESANKVAVDVITEYIEFWEEAERAKQEVYAMQQQRFSNIKAEMLRRPLHEAGTEPEPIQKPHKGQKGNR